MKEQLPSWVRWFISQMATGKDQEIIEGDIKEALAEGPKGSIRRYGIIVREMMGLVRWSLLKRKRQNRPSGMYMNLMKVIIRNLRRKWNYALINVIGLSVSMTVFALILTHVTHELGFDRFHKDHDHLFRLTYQENADEPVDGHWARVPVDWVNIIPEYFSRVEHFVRFQSFRFRDIRVDEQAFREDYAYAVDPDVFQVFDFQFIAGDAQALKQPNSVVLTESIAKKYFGEVNAMGRTLRTLEPGGSEISYQITGIIEDFPANSHLPINLLTSINNREDRRGWAYIYVKLVKPDDAAVIQSQMSEFIDTHSPDPETTNMINLQAVTDIHLQSDLAREIVPNNRLSYVLIFLAASIFLLVVSTINFANLNTVQSMSRAREVGIRKVLGGSRSHLGRYFYLEALSLFTGSLILAALGYVLLLPYLERFLGQNLLPNYPIITTAMIVLLIVIPWITSLYPSQWLSRLQTITALKQQLPSSGKLSGKRILVGIQFTLAMILISATLITKKQFSFLQNKNLGFHGDQVLAIKHIPAAAKRQLKFVREKLVSLPAVEEVSAVMELPGSAVRDGIILLKPGQDTDEGTNVDIQIVEPNFPEMMEMELIAGDPIPYATTYSNLPEGSSGADIFAAIGKRKRHYVLNETAVRLLGWEPEDAIGQLVLGYNPFYQLAEGPIVGVVKDYHQESLRESIDPVLMVYEPIWLNHLLIRADLSDFMATMDRIEDFWQTNYPGFPMDLTFLENDLNNLYQQERKQLQLLQVFSSIAIVMAAIGLIGLMGYSIRTRQKELMIRKVLGANLSSLIKLLAREYVLSLAVGLALSIPLVWGLMGEWLTYYAYHVEIEGTSFMIGALVLCLLVLFPLVTLVLRSDQNPAEVLKND